MAVFLLFFLLDSLKGLMSELLIKGCMVTNIAVKIEQSPLEGSHMVESTVVRSCSFAATVIIRTTVVVN